MWQKISLIAFFFCVIILGIFLISLYRTPAKPTLESPQRTLTKEISSQVASGVGVSQNGRIGETIEKSITFAIAGDLMLDRGIDASFRGEKIYNIFDNLDKTIFAGKDLALLNLEGPISKDEITLDNTYDNLIFNFPPLTPKVLSSLSINAVSLANNHSLNKGESGFQNTLSVLKSENIKSVGRQVGFDDRSIIRLESATGGRLAVIAIESLEDDADIAPYIQAEKSAGYNVMVFPHWGIEYADKHNTFQENLAHRWIEAGADLVVGSHPHVIQDAEVYREKPIFYSLGNFVFDQTFSVETQRGLVLAGSITDSSIEISLLPTKQLKLKPELLAGSEKDQFVKDLKKFVCKYK